ncbi:hypothetical protein EC957_009937 [Mortierella hygrophila]|uniref:Uncharacterized protein n=1 Tax=Mortierella hygrophila TaxID=979708 RepID=A0A9P6FB68_9FUNG|nr:hypothetical protein EC957_009937 [Mortierella hygrophila]
MPWRSEFDGHPRREFTPPVEELNQSYGIQDGSPARLTTPATDFELNITRPRWTWDRHLPLLTYLHLTSEFAYLFEFKFLQGCPVLKTLWLDIRSTITGEHIGVNSEAELVLKAEAQNHDDNGNEPPLAFFITNTL